MRSDGFSLFAEKTGTRKNGLYVKDKKGKESKIEGDYPKWRSVIPTKDTNSSKVDVQSLRDFLSSVKANNAKDFRDGKARVIIRTDYGDYLYNAKLLSQVADFMEKHGIDELQFEGRYGKTAAQNKSAIGLLMPIFFEGTGLEELEAFGYDIRTDKRGERFSLGDSPESFDARRERAVREKGTVMPGLKDAEVKVVDVPRHDFTGTGKEAMRAAEKWAKENIKGSHTATNSRGDEFSYDISGKSIEKYVSASSVANSASLGVHLSVLKKLPDVIANSIEVEEHPDYTKDSAGHRSADNNVNTQSLIHRFYGAANIQGKTYRIKTTIREYADVNRNPKAHNYQVTKIELLDAPPLVDIETSNRRVAMTSNNSISAAKLLKGVEKSYDPGKKILSASKEADNSQARFSLPDDVKLTKRERELRDGLIEKVSRAVGAETVITDVETGERVLDMLNGRARLSRGQKRALETASVSSNEEHQPTVVSNADGAKVLENLDKLAKDFENLSNRPKRRFK